MTTAIYHPQGDLFATYIPYLPLRHQHEIMERPFFSLSKSPRKTPIQYTSPDGKVFVRVAPGADHPMASMYDQDILIGAISILIHRRNNRMNDISRSLRFYPQDLLRMIGRTTSGRDYIGLRAGLARLKATTITTNIRAGHKEKHAMFNWIDSWTDETDRDATISQGMSITLSDWLYEGAMMKGGVLKLSQDYFKIRGGYQRWLYMIGRKHASEPTGWKFKFSTLYQKSGTESEPRGFKFAILKIVRANDLPDFNLHVPDESAKDPVLHITPRQTAAALPDNDADTFDIAPDSAPAATDEPPDTSGIPKTILAQLSKEIPHFLPSYLKQQYDDWHRSRGGLPLTYGKEFLEFARDYAQRRLPLTTPSSPLLDGPTPSGHQLSDDARKRFRKHFPGRDIHYLERLFTDWLAGKTPPRNYEAAFFGFAKQHASKNPV